MRLRRKQKAERRDPNRILPPEGVPLTLTIAGVGVRIGAQLTDIAITVIAAVCLLILCFMLKLATPRSLVAIAAFLFFAIRIPYYALTELAWNGQTLGKKLMKIKVVAHDGGSLSTHALVLRNLMKEAEIFLPGTLVLTLNAKAPVASLIAFAWVLGTLIVPVFDRYHRRLGDLMAGTHVIHLPQPILLKDLACDAPLVARQTAGFTFLAHQLDHYGAFELQTLEQLLRAQDTLAPASVARNRKTVAGIVERIRAKIGHADPVLPEDHLTFLKAFYNAQRAHLEQRQLFGDRRADKHHADADPPA